MSGGKSRAADVVVMQHMRQTPSVSQTDVVVIVVVGQGPSATTRDQPASSSAAARQMWTNKARCSRAVAINQAARLFRNTLLWPVEGLKMDTHRRSRSHKSVSFV